MNKRYGVVGRHPWNRKHFEQCLHGTPGEWHFAGTPEELQRIEDDADSYRYLFFLHWSDKVPSDLLQRVECVCFHMTDVPFGRGGSPLQNLIVGGFRETKLTALRMTPELDGGPVYLKVPLSLEGGTAEEIYQRVSRLSCELALRIAAGEPLPERQQGAPVVFRRRRPEDSAIPDGGGFAGEPLRSYPNA